MARRFVVIGAGVAGGTAAATLRERGFDGNVVLIGAEPHHPYERPPLSKSLLRGETPFRDCLVRPPDFWAERDIEVRLGTPAPGGDLQSQVVKVVDGRAGPVAALRLHAGARRRRPP